MRLSRPGTILERFLTRPLRPSDNAPARRSHRFHRHSLRIEGELFRELTTLCSRPGCQYSVT